MQQDRATFHTSNVILQVVKETFPNKLISRRADIQWPPKSSDPLHAHTLLRFFSVGIPEKSFVL